MMCAIVATNVFLLVTLTTTLVSSDEQLNCHVSPQGLNHIVTKNPNDTALLAKCSRLVIDLGPPEHRGHLVLQSLWTLAHAQNIRASRPGLEILLKINLGPEDTKHLVSEEYKQTFVTPLIDYIHEHGLSGVVLRFDHNYKVQLQGTQMADKMETFRFLEWVRSKLNVSKTIGLVTGTRGPFGSVEEQDCQALDSNVDFIELAAESFDLDTYVYRIPGTCAWRSESLPGDGGVDEKAVQLSKTLVDRWRKCENLVNKTILAIPWPLKIDQGSCKPNAKEMAYQDVCHYQGIWHDDVKLLIVTYHRGALRATYGVHVTNRQTIEAIVQNGRNSQLAGFASMSLDFDDYENKCGNGSLPFFNHLVGLMENTTSTPKPNISNADKPQRLEPSLAIAQTTPGTRKIKNYVRTSTRSTSDLYYLFDF
ncbi:hypothetical protein HDE_03953 [Halotydeus destructor]|nr:hypothetical protein HDE_03953 [Halotydeus destructor]